VKAAKDTNSRLDSVARRAKELSDKKMEEKFQAFGQQVKKFHEKLVIRKENIELQQWDTKHANEERQQKHMQTFQNLKQLDRDKLLQSIHEKQN